MAIAFRRALLILPILFSAAIASMPFCSAHADGIEAAAAGIQNFDETPFDVHKIKALAFDIQGSTVDFTTPLMQMGERINTEKGLSLDWGAMSTDWRHHYHDIQVTVLDRKRPYVPLEQVYRESLNTLLEQYKIGDRFSASERDRMANVWSQMIPWPDSKEGITLLKQRFVVATLSNAGMATVSKIIKNGGLPFDVVLTGELAKSYKPDHKVYQLAVDYLGFEKGEIMMVATHKYDLKAARAFGFRTAFFPRPLEYGPDTRVDDKPEPYIDVMAADIVDLAKKLGIETPNVTGSLDSVALSAN